MNVELDKADLISLVRGNSPGYPLIHEFEERNLGTFRGQYGVWEWDKRELEKLSEEELYVVYQKCKNS